MLLAEEFQLKLSLGSVGRLLKQLGFERQCRRCSEPWNRIRNASGNGWTRSIPAFAGKHNGKGAEIYFGDEAGVRSDCHGGRTWGAKGKTPVGN